MTAMKVRMSAHRQWRDVGRSSVADTLARLSVYTVPSDATTYTSLLPHFLSPKTTLPHTAFVIVLDWTRPWTFVEELEAWLRWVEQWARGDGSREVEIVREENHERRACLFFICARMNLCKYSTSASTPLHGTFCGRFACRFEFDIKHCSSSWSRHFYT